MDARTEVADKVHSILQQWVQHKTDTSGGNLTYNHETIPTIEVGRLTISFEPRTFNPQLFAGAYSIPFREGTPAKKSKRVWSLFYRENNLYISDIFSGERHMMRIVSGREETVEKTNFFFDLDGSPLFSEADYKKIYELDCGFRDAFMKMADALYGAK